MPWDLVEIADTFTCFTAKRRRREVQAYDAGPHGPGYAGSGSDAKEVEEDPPELRRMGFVLNYSSKASGYLTYPYNQARTYMPENLALLLYWSIKPRRRSSGGSSSSSSSASEPQPA